MPRIIRSIPTAPIRLPVFFVFTIICASLGAVSATSIVQTQLVSQTITNCGLTSPAFCETFDTAASIGNRSGQLNGTLWGTSRESGDQNFQVPANGWGQANLSLCGSTTPIAPDNDVFVCNGQLVEGQDDNQTVTSLAMYPKQPFDFAGRTGKVTFDVANDTQGSHAAWPEFWMSSRPIPDPFQHEGAFAPPQDGFGIRFSGFTDASGLGSSCPEGPGYVGADSAVVVRNYVVDDSFFGGGIRVSGIDCVKQPTTAGQLNHYEIDVSQNQIDVYGTDAGTTSPLKHLAVIMNANLTLSRGLIWIEDVHYNGNKFGTQGTHSFTWDNVGFDGPVLPRDLTFDINDSLTSAGQIDANNGLPVLNLGWFVDAGTTQPYMFNLNGISNASGAALMFEFWYEANGGFNINYTINGHAYTALWPYPDTASFSVRSIFIPLNLADLVTGANQVTITPPVAMNISNIDILLIGAGGIPGAPTSTPAPATATPTPTDTPLPATATPTPLPATATPTAIVPTDTPTPTPTAVPPTATPTATPKPKHHGRPLR